VNVVRQSPPLITLLTDFGEGSPYVAAMKGVILGICPQAIIVDITHAIRPQAVEEGAFILSTVISSFSRGAIHVAVVDPGVGTSRLPIAINTGDAVFVGPDNGLLSAAIPDALRPEARAGAGPAPVAAIAMRTIHLDRPAYHRPQVSATFHGRDIFAPVAARLAAGLTLDDLGSPVESVLAFPVWCAQRAADGSLRGRAITIDHFGNVITTIRAIDLPDASFTLEIAGREFNGPQSTYQDGPDDVVYTGSSGYLEVGLRNGNAAEALGVAVNDPVRVRPHHNP
jgi:S-adenosylmethionine hydrolase